MCGSSLSSKCEALSSNPSTTKKNNKGISLFVCFAVLELELKAYTLSHSTSPFFVMGFFEIGLLELCAQASFKP
jgi:hypothetical protein